MKQKQFKKLITLIVAFSLVSLFSFSPFTQNARAVDSITDAFDRISDSDVSVVATSTFGYVLGINPGADGYVEFAFPSQFGNIPANANITCNGGGTASGGGTKTARCTYGGGTAPGQATTTVGGYTNPATANEYTIDITSYDSTGTILERVQVMVAIIDDVWMTARVNATLNFVISGLDAGINVNGVDCTATTTATTTPFGTLNVNVPSTVCQQLNVTTNADDGFTVTVWASDELTSDSGSNINSFDNSPNNTGSSSPHAWTAPIGTLDQYHTYGHMGLTSEDDSLSNGDHFGASLYVGFNDIVPVEVMWNHEPSNGTGAGDGETRVAYTAEISALQEAGDYETTLTYICTPVY